MAVNEGVSTDLHVTRVGRGPTMLVMHGGMGWDHTYLRAGLDALSERVELVYYDHRGNGRSPRPETPAGWEQLSHARWVDDAEALRSALGCEQVIVFGHSYGGVIAQEYALTHPRRVSALILCSTYPAFDYLEAALALAEARATAAQHATLIQGLSAPPPDDAAFGALFRAVLPIYFHHPTAARLAAFDRTCFSAGVFARAAAGCLPTFSTLDRLDAIMVPTLVLGGVEDWIAPPEYGARRLYAGLPQAELVLFERSGHFPFLEEPEAFTAVVAAWLQELIAAHGGSEHVVHPGREDIQRA